MPISSPTDIAGCTVWLAADRDTYANNDPVGLADNGGSGGDWTAAGSNRPTYKTGITPTGKAVYRFDGTDDYLIGPDSFAGLTAGSAFVVVKIVTDPPASSAQSGLWALGTGPSSTLYPFTDGHVYEDAFLTTRPDTGDPTLDLSTAFRVYAVTATNGDFNTYLDGTLQFNTATATMGGITIPRLGASNQGGGSPTFCCQGDIAALIVYDSVLSAGNRSDVLTYLTQRYITGTSAGSAGFQGNAFQPNAFQEGSFFNPQLVTPGTLALALTPFTPTVATPRLVTPGTLALVLTPFAPTVLAYHNQSGFQTAFQGDAFQVGWQFSFKP